MPPRVSSDIVYSSFTSPSPILDVHNSVHVAKHTFTSAHGALVAKTDFAESVLISHASGEASRTETELRLPWEA